MATIIVVVDYRNLCKICSYSILSGAIACCYATEPDEIAHRIAKRLYCIRADNPDATLIFANDTPPYWRSKYLISWYSDQGLEPVGYKSNRDGMSWPFASSKENLNELYGLLFNQLSSALDAFRAADPGLEADDIWGMLVSVAVKKGLTVQGVSSDFDWRQLCGSGVTINDPVTNEIITEPVDIRPKCVAGDRGDNIMGCNKRTKAITPNKTMWGIDGATKLIATHTEAEWMSLIDKNVYQRNYNLIKLPCPLWKIDMASALDDILVDPVAGDAVAILDRYGITEPVRKLLNDKAERNAWIKRLRAFLQEKNRIVTEKIVDEA